MPTPLVLLHPFPVDHRFWEPLLARLDGAVDPLLPDAPGFGRHPRRPGWTIAEWADEVAELIASRAQGAVVCGLSMGGYAALALAARHPGAMRGLILADTRSEADDAAVRAARAAGIRQIEDEGLEAYLAAALPRLTAPGATPEARGLIARLAAQQDPGAVCDALAALGARPDRSAELGAITVPTLVIVGDQDVPTPPGAARSLAEGIPGARLTVVPGAGHMTAVEDPDSVAAAIVGHLAILRAS